MKRNVRIISPKRWEANYSGNMPTISVNERVHVGDIAYDTSNESVWVCTNITTPVWKNITIIGDNSERIDANETNISVLDDEVNNINSTVQDHDGIIQQIEPIVYDNTNRIETNEADISNNLGRIDTNESEISDNTNRIDNNEASLITNVEFITTNETAISELQDEVTGLSAEIQGLSASEIEVDTEDFVYNLYDVSDNVQSALEKLDTVGMVQSENKTGDVITWNANTEQILNITLDRPITNLENIKNTKLGQKFTLVLTQDDTGNREIVFGDHQSTSTDTTDCYWSTNNEVAITFENTTLDYDQIVNNKTSVNLSDLWATDNRLNYNKMLVIDKDSDADEIIIEHPFINDSTADEYLDWVSDIEFVTNDYIFINDFNIDIRPNAKTIIEITSMGNNTLYCKCISNNKNMAIERLFQNFKFYLIDGKIWVTRQTNGSNVVNNNYLLRQTSNAGDVDSNVSIRSGDRYSLLRYNMDFTTRIQLTDNNAIKPNTANNRYTYFAGLLQAWKTTLEESSGAIGFTADPTTGNIHCITKNLDIVTDIDTGIAVSTDMLKLYFTATIDKVNFYINDTFIATSTTNIVPYTIGPRETLSRYIDDGTDNIITQVEYIDLKYKPKEFI